MLLPMSRHLASACLNGRLSGRLYGCPPSCLMASLCTHRSVNLWNFPR